MQKLFRLSVLFLLISCTSINPDKEEIKPNILFIMSDDHALEAISAYQGRYAEVCPTPNIDRLAEEGMMFTHAFCTNSICTPSRAAILTGKYNHKNGVKSNIPTPLKTPENVFDSRQQHVGRILSDNGYFSAIYGKWHLGSLPRGFDDWKVLPNQGNYFDPAFLQKPEEKILPDQNMLLVVREEGMNKINPAMIKQDFALKTNYKGFSTDIVTDLTINSIKERDKNKPFFIMCHYKAPHAPFQYAARYRHLFENIKIPEPENLYDDYEDRSDAAKNARLKLLDINQNNLRQSIPEGLTGDRLLSFIYQAFIKNYLRSVKGIDDNIGRLLNALDQEGIADNTIVVYTSDQGFFLGEHGYYDKRMFYEEPIKMPFLIRYPDKIKPNKKNDNFILNVDFAPTFLSFANAAVPDDMQGVSFKNILLGKEENNWRSSFYYRYWMHIVGHGIPAHFGIRNQRYKLIFYYGLPLNIPGAKEKTPPEWEFFDLQKDPLEMHNEYDNPDYQEEITDLKKELISLRKKYDDTDKDYLEMIELLNKEDLFRLN